MSRKGTRRVLVGFLVVANLVVFGGLAAVWWAANQVSSAVPTIPASDLSLAGGSRSPTDPLTFLLVGSDSREHLEDLTNFGPAGGQRSDVMILVQVIPDEGRIQMLSIPRDLKVTHGGRTGRINATFSSGPGNLVAALTEETGLPIHHYLQVEFGGFAAIVDAIGGIELAFPYPARDTKSGFSVAAGVQRLDGMMALAFARSRSYQELRGGSWVSVDANDIGRTRRQQDVLMAILTQVDRPTSLDGFSRLVDALSGFVVSDSEFDAEEIVTLAWTMRSVTGADVEAMTLPVRTSNENGTSYVVRVEPAASLVIDAFAAGAVLDPDAEARVQVQNGNAVPGSAGAVGSRLSEAGFDVVGTVDSARSDYAITQVIAQTGHFALAQAVVDALGYGEVVVGQTPPDIEVIVIVGADAPAP